MACVAVILIVLGLAGCGIADRVVAESTQDRTPSLPDNPVEPPLDQPQDPAPSPPRGVEYDEFDLWSTGQEAEFPAIFGDTNPFSGMALYEPHPALADEHGVFVVTLLDNCVIIINSHRADVQAGRFSMVLYPRYIRDPGWQAWDISPGEVGVYLDDVRGACGEEMPLYGSPVESPPQV